MYEITLGNGWQSYASSLPADTAPLGVIRDSDGSLGALVQVKAANYPGCRDTYCRVNAGCWSALDQGAVRLALEPT